MAERKGRPRSDNQRDLCVACFIVPEDLSSGFPDGLVVYPVFDCGLADNSLVPLTKLLIPDFQFLFACTEVSLTQLIVRASTSNAVRSGYRTGALCHLLAVAQMSPSPPRSTYAMAIVWSFGMCWK